MGERPIQFDILRTGASGLDEYENVSIAFDVTCILHAESLTANRGYALRETPVRSPWLKDYDTPGNRPTDWRGRFDVSRWGIFIARSNYAVVGGAVGVFRSPIVDILERREDLAVLWDIRVARTVRGKGVGSALLASTEEWAREKGARRMKVETQNINVPACRFYARNGFALECVKPLAYPELPEEIQLLWYKDL